MEIRLFLEQHPGSTLGALQDFLVRVVGENAKETGFGLQAEYLSMTTDFMDDTKDRGANLEADVDAVNAMVARYGRNLPLEEYLQT